MRYFVYYHLQLTNDMDMINWLRSVHQYGKLQRWRIGYENNAVATHPDTARILLNASCTAFICHYQTYHFEKCST